MINALPNGITEGLNFLLSYCILELNVREHSLAGKPEKGFGWRAEHEENREEPLECGRRFSYNSRKLCRSLEARSRVTWNRFVCFVFLYM